MMGNTEVCLSATEPGASFSVEAFSSTKGLAGNFMRCFLSPDGLFICRSSNSLHWDIIGIKTYSGYNMAVAG